MPPDPPREQGPEGLATPTQINATPTSKTVENPGQAMFGISGSVFPARGNDHKKETTSTKL